MAKERILAVRNLGGVPELDKHITKDQNAEPAKRYQVSDEFFSNLHNARIAVKRIHEMSDHPYTGGPIIKSAAKKMPKAEVIKPVTAKILAKHIERNAKSRNKKVQPYGIMADLMGTKPVETIFTVRTPSGVEVSCNNVNAVGDLLRVIHAHK